MVFYPLCRLVSVILLLPTAWAVPDETHTTGMTVTSCPSYASLLAEDLKAWSPRNLEGRWYMLATTEPTLPKGCTCGVNTFTVSDDESEYSYVNQDYCFDSMNITVHIAGVIPDVEGEPGK